MTVNNKVQGWIRKGNDLFERGKYDEAIEWFDKVILYEEDYALAWIHKGITFYHMKQYNNAIEFLDKAIEIDRFNVWPWLYKGIIFEDKREFHEALKFYDKTIEINPQSEYAWCGKGNAFYYLQKYDEAITCYDKAIELNTNFALSWNNKGQVLNRMEIYDEAIICIDRALNINPNYHTAWTSKSTSLLGIGNLSEARYCLNMSINLSLKNFEKLGIEDQITLAENLIKVERCEEGRKYLSQAMSETDDTALQSIIRFLILSSRVIDGDSTNFLLELPSFIEYYLDREPDFKIGEEYWDFSGLGNIIKSKSDIDSEEKILLLTLIDLLNGRIERNISSIFTEIIDLATRLLSNVATKLTDK
jgi:tetratricopeptide (TPR) repeat protein